MKGFKKVYILPAILLLTVGMAVGVEVKTFLSGSDMSQLKKLEDAFLLVNRQYVDTVDPNKVAEDAIKGMLLELDPHSSYISAEEMQEVTEEYTGSFGGVGILFEIMNDTARVVSTVAGGPSEKAGIQAGDRIIGVNDTTAVGFTNNQVQKYLKGPVGTQVAIRVKRPGVKAPLSFSLKRDRIPLYTVDSSYMVDSQTGYMRISRFALTTYDEFMEHLSELRGKGMKRLVLDLRGNPGGVMDAAVSIADELIGGERTIVYTKSRHKELESTHRSTPGGAFEKQPIIVLVSPYSASASEILAGALQDHDRALIVGQRTFGKGLVQQQFRLSDGSVLQMTVSRYYTPSGRLIQTPYKSGDQKDYYTAKFSDFEDATYHPSDYIEKVPDSLKFRTTHGRVVFGGGGIMPDLVVAPDTAEFKEAIASNGLDYLFVNEWFDKNEVQVRNRWGKNEEAFVQSFTVEDAMWNAFIQFLGTKDTRLTSNSGAVDRKKGVYPASEAASGRAVLSTRIKGYMARRLYGSDAANKLFNSVDPVLAAALKMWPKAEELARNK